MKDQAKPNVAQARRAKTNKSAWIILYQGCASANTSTLKKNQNQYPPKQVIIAPKCHNNVILEGVEDPAVGNENINKAYVIQKIIVPYIPSTWATLLLPLPSSEVVAISCATVFKITEVL